MTGKIISRDIVIHSCCVPARQWIDLDFFALFLKQWKMRTLIIVISLTSGDPPSELLQCNLQRYRLTQITAFVGKAMVQQAIHLGKLAREND